MLNEVSKHLEKFSKKKFEKKNELSKHLEKIEKKNSKFSQKPFEDDLSS